MDTDLASAVDDLAMSLQAQKGQRTQDDLPDYHTQRQRATPWRGSKLLEGIIGAHVARHSRQISSPGKTACN
jgi:hypothetical protein